MDKWGEVADALETELVYRCILSCKDLSERREDCDGEDLRERREDSDGEDLSERREDCDGEYWDCLCADEGKERLWENIQEAAYLEEIGDQWTVWYRPWAKGHRLDGEIVQRIVRQKHPPYIIKLHHLN